MFGVNLGGRNASSAGGDGGDTNTVAESVKKEVDSRVSQWQKTDGRGGAMGSAPGDNRTDAFEARQPPAELTALGKKLLFG